MPIPRVYSKTAEAPVASYDYVDIAEGTGVVLFYGFSDQGAAPGDGHSLTKSTPFSDTIETTAFNVDFDLSPFNLPQTIEGTAIVSFSWAQTLAAGTRFVTATIRKVIDGTPSDIAVASGAIVDWAAGAPRTDLIKIPNIPRTLFKEGEVLRLNMTSTIVTGGSTSWLAHDPQGRDGTNIVPSTDASSTTKLEFYCPFRLDL